MAMVVIGQGLYNNQDRWKNILGCQLGVHGVSSGHVMGMNQTVLSVAIKRWWFFVVMGMLRNSGSLGFSPFAMVTISCYDVVRGCCGDQEWLWKGNYGRGKSC